LASLFVTITCHRGANHRRVFPRPVSFFSSFPRVATADFGWIFFLTALRFDLSGIRAENYRAPKFTKTGRVVNFQSCNT
jgi:hypothetical protein